VRGRDLHAALKTEVVSAHDLPGLRLVLTKLVWGKDEFAFSLHAAPTSYSTYGLQMPDLLSFLGFTRSACPFTGRDECYARWIDPRLNIAALGEALTGAHGALTKAQGHLEACGFLLPQPEGWGYFYGRESSGARSSPYSECSGDGHTSPHSETMKCVEDENFNFVFSWIKGGTDKGWTTHYKPKIEPISPEVEAVLNFIELKHFEQCPMFDFEPCWWRFTAFSPTGFLESNADRAHGWFDANQQHFSAGIERLLETQRLVEPFGIRFLSFGEAVQRREVELARRIVRTKKTGAASFPDRFDVAISFAGTERELAEKLATAARDAGFQTFYDDFYKFALWGKDLVEFFDDIYRKRSRYCVMFISKEYAERMWTIQERRSALARQLEEKGQEYILPIRCDGTELPGLPPTIGYLSIKEHCIDSVAKILIEKLKTAST
jgi:hypothetical protein